MDAEFKFNEDDFKRAIGDYQKKLGHRVTEVGELTLTRAKERTHVKTGTNKRSITLEVFDGKSVRTVGEMKSANAIPRNEDTVGIAVYTQSGYGGFGEIGTSKMAAWPYIRPAFQETVDELMSDLEGSAGDAR